MEIPLERASIFYDGLDHPECVAVHPDGSVWAGGEAGQIYRIAPDGGGAEEIARTGGFVLGIAFSPDARWLAACDLSRRCVWRLDLETRALELFAEGAGGADRFGIPNFPVFARDGRLYVSDSGAFRQVKGRILRFDPDGRGELWHAGPFDFANGLALDPAEEFLYVVCSFLPGVERVRIRPDGSAGGRERFVELPQAVPDGLAFDAAGRLYVSCYAPQRIYRVGADRQPVVWIEDWEAHTICNPTNIAFGGPGFDHLFTANLGRWHVTRIEAGTRGAPLAVFGNRESGIGVGADPRVRPLPDGDQSAIRDPQSAILHHEPSWRIAATAVEAFLTERGGHLGPVVFRAGGRTIEPYAVAPWTEEPLAAGLPPMLAVLRGDFFCLPFGGNDAPFRGERHPPHGETANARWTLEGIEEEPGARTLHASLRTGVRPGRVDKYVTLVDGHAAVYSRHVVSGMEGPMSFGHHAMLRFPDRPGSGLVATSPFVLGRVAPEPVERPEARGYSLLRPDAPFSTLEAVPTITGETADLSRYPARRGYEDLVLLVSDPAVRPAWTAVTFPEEGFVWLALKDPRVLRQTVFWMSNGGRHYPPWNGRHVNVMGLEEVTSYFHYGLARSAAPNPLSEAGYPTHAVLSAAEPLEVRYVNAVAAVPPGFDRVRAVEPAPGGDAVVLRSESGLAVAVPLRLEFLG